MTTGGADYEGGVSTCGCSLWVIASGLAGAVPTVARRWMVLRGGGRFPAAPPPASVSGGPDAGSGGGAGVSPSESSGDAWGSLPAGRTPTTGEPRTSLPSAV